MKLSAQTKHMSSSGFEMKFQVVIRGVQGHARRTKYGQSHGSLEALIEQLRTQLHAKDLELTQLKVSL